MYVHIYIYISVLTAMAVLVSCNFESHNSKKCSRALCGAHLTQSCVLSVTLPSALTMASFASCLV